MTYHSPNFNLNWLTSGFAPVTLEHLNEKAAMMSRIDNKYVLDRWTLERVLPNLRAEFDVLEISERRAFTYESRYFDDPQRSAYYERHQGVRKRFKVRVRRYMDADLCFLEVKVKGTRGMTLKHRVRYDANQLAALTPEGHKFVRATYNGHYGKPFRYDLKYALDVRYQRITLVAKTGGERMTIDTRMHFGTADKSLDATDDLFILETKSALGRGFADRCLRRVHARPTPKCSKYCVGMAALGEVGIWNSFMPAMRQLQLLKGTDLNVKPILRRAA